MNKIRVSRKTVEDAITEASVELGVVSSELSYEIIEKGSTGFLGIGSKQAVIEAWRKSDETKPAKAKKEKTKVIESEKEEKEAKEIQEEQQLAEVLPETKEVCEKFVKDVLAAMNLEVEITSYVDEDGSLSLEIKGDNMGVLIGKRGQTIDSLQYLTNRVANKMQDGYVRVKLDTENYRARRKETLENLAKNIASKVKRTKRAVSLEPMNPYERRIIHSVLQGDKYVSTHSEGEEPYRRIVVTLARK